MSGSDVRRLNYDRLDSTNAEALRLARDGEVGPIWIDAEEQFQGRGRAGRVWQGAAGNLMSSYLFSLTAPGAVLAQLSLVAGIAVFEAVSHHGATSQTDLQLKWPNDLLLKGAKVGGTLIETSNFAGRRVGVIGIGLNLAAAPDIDGVATADLKPVLTDGVDLEMMRQTLADKLAFWLSVWSDGSGFPAVRTAWLTYGPPLNQSLAVKVGDAVHHGAFAGLDEHGALCLMGRDGEKRCYTFGDVSVTGGGTLATQISPHE